MLDLKPALEISVEIHGSQREKSGDPYFGHLIHVMDQMDTDEERAVAILHDSVEDAANEGMREALLGRIRNAYGPEVADAVALLSHVDQTPYMEYIRRLSTNPLAVKVKMADLKDNRRPDRLRRLPREESSRLWDKYEEAVHFLLTAEMNRELTAGTSAPSPPAKS